MWDLVGNPKGWFSHNEAQIELLEPLLHFQKKEKSDQGLNQCIFLDAMFYCIATLLKPKDDYGTNFPAFRISNI